MGMTVVVVIIAGAAGIIVLVVTAGRAGAGTGVISVEAGTGAAGAAGFEHPAVKMTARMRKISVVPARLFITGYTPYLTLIVALCFNF
jgi:preprotein translocase subunit SecG